MHPGDEVIYFEPSFDSYAPIVRLQGATPVAIKLSPEHFRVNWDEVAAAINPRTRMIIVNTPHNPTATVFSADDLERLAQLTRDTGIVILSDEVYEHVVFDGAQHQSMARHRELAERSVIVSSFGKSFHVTGWRVGYCLAPAELMDEIRKVHQFMVFAADTPMQVAFAEILARPDRLSRPVGVLPGQARPARASWLIRVSSCCRAKARSSCSRASGTLGRKRQRFRAAPDPRCTRRDDSAVGVLYRRHRRRRDPAQFSKDDATLVEARGGCVRCKARTETGDGSVAPTRHRRSR